MVMIVAVRMTMTMATSIMAIVMPMAMVIVIVAMANRIMMRMLMRGVIVLTMIVMRRALRIGAAFRIERRFDFKHPRTKSACHIRNHMITPDTQRFRHDLRRQMPVAQMPRDAHEMMCILAAYFEQRLGRSNHFDDTSIFQYKPIATAQRNGLR